MDGQQPQHGCPGCRRLEREVAELKRQVADLLDQVQRLTTALDAERRAGKRQAAPFRKAAGPKPDPKPPGRKAGDDHGPHAHRMAAAPETIDETYPVPLPACCPHCGDKRLTPTRVVVQYQTEIPRRPLQRQFNIQIGQCQGCSKSVQGRHPLQTSNAVGAAAAQLGPDAHAAMTILNKDLGLSHGKVARVFRQLFGIRVARATSARSLQRTAHRCVPTARQIRAAIRASPWLVPDETGWRVSARNAWLHVVVGPRATWYGIADNRSHHPLANLLTPGWAGVLVHDGWAPYDQLPHVRHQQCLAHLLRRCRELLATATRAAVRFPRRIRALLQRALTLRDRHGAAELSDHGLAVARGRLQHQLEDAIYPSKTNPDNERLAQHLWNHRDDLLTFLHTPGLDATNWRAEQAIRPAVVNRKVWGGNRTWRGAWVQGLLMSVIRTCHQQARDILADLHTVLCSPQPLALLSSGR